MEDGRLREWADDRKEWRVLLQMQVIEIYAATLIGPGTI